MRPILEVVAVLVGGGIHAVATLGLDLHGVDILVIGLAFLGYVVVRSRVPGVLADWGFRRSGLRECARATAVLVGGGTLVLAAVAAVGGSLVVDRGLLVALCLYPLWGLIQQTLVLALLARNLDRLGLPRPSVMIVAALGFAAVHLPDLPLCAATAALGAACCALYFRYRNLWPLGLAHGVLGAVFYRWILGRDVWGELATAWS